MGPSTQPDRPGDGAERGGLVVEHLGYMPNPVDYRKAWERQREVHAEVVVGDRPDTVLLCEHAPVFTAGARTRSSELPSAEAAGGVDVIPVDRGGKITWHGPGQLVGYPIVRLADPVDVVAYVRDLEEALIGVCADLGVTAGRVPGRSGVWVGPDARGVERKVAAIGVRVAQGVTMHGFALNCDCDLTAFGRIVPCGIADAGVTSLSAELGRRVGVADVLEPVERHLRAVLRPGARTATPAPVAAAS
jgi:lipoyl(octanoyl) transferase